MKNLKKKIAALGVGLAVMAYSAMSMTASALEYHDDWGPRYFTPDHGAFYANNDQVFVENLQWSASDLAQIASEDAGSIGTYTSEFEFRNLSANGDKLKPTDIWSHVTSFSSNLPSYFYEFPDPDDITIGCRSTADCTASTKYYGRLKIWPVSTIGVPNTAIHYQFESELGNWIPVASTIKQDSLPLKAELYGTCQFSMYYQW